MKAVAVALFQDSRDGTAVGVPRLYHSLCHIFTWESLRHTNVLF